MSALIRLGAPLALGVLAGALTAPASRAQELDERCQKIVSAICDGKRLGRCFQNEKMWDDVPARCQGDVQTMIEMEREALQEQKQERREERRKARRGEGLSYACGGIIRSRASGSSAKVGSVQEGEEIEVLEETGVWTDDFQWFRIRYNGLEGYQWGGIFWTQGGRKGTIPSCNG
ncbi:SH3 domain-containing protein [Chenggangzhangella methanolivorans]|uniref:SH3 domain-containing protein n=1 Tax=Chenggangzhangella methanolivorans TaxID=1437009 RepID=A0A9E6UJV6_9HYPH|nr:SH3 domain-containing protein [Chenggangzhangella methanolivorans]QZN98531.1 SH3 domain-containing protein [Chenggangzhangella methanolivorans]